MRIIAGLYRGRRLIAPDGLETRPTSDRVREAVFSSLGPLGGATVLDLYAGTGALGIEALSRGAARSIFVEEAKAAIAALRENLAKIDLVPKTRVIAQTVARAANSLAKDGPFHLIFVDPPYALLDEVPKAIEKLIAAGALTPGARVVVEHSRKDPPPPIAGLELRSTRFYGTTAVTYYVHVVPPVLPVPEPPIEPRIEPPAEPPADAPS